MTAASLIVVQIRTLANGPSQESLEESGQRGPVACIKRTLRKAAKSQDESR